MTRPQICKQSGNCAEIRPRPCSQAASLVVLSKDDYMTSTLITAANMGRPLFEPIKSQTSPRVPPD
jgi:hypothetical protein